MTTLRERKGFLIFGLIALILLLVSFAAYQVTGPMGIEDRFNAAAGLSHESDNTEEGGIAGFFIEGSSLMYLLVLLALVIACTVIYRRYHE